MNILREDLRVAIRRMRQQPGFSVVAILTLALGLGANVAVFTLVHSLMLRQLPVDRPNELYRLGDDSRCCINSGLQKNYSLFSYRLYEQLRDNTEEFSQLAALQAGPMALGVRRAGASVGTSVPGQFVSANYFAMFGVRPAAGRLLQPDDDKPGAAPVAVMSYRVWEQNYGLDASVVGAAFVIDGTPVTIVGVTPPASFGDTVRADPAAIWIPIGQEPAVRGTGSLVDRVDQDWLYAIGRIAPGARPEQIASHVTSELRQWLGAQAFVPSPKAEKIAQQSIVVSPAGGGVGLMRIAFARSLNMLFLTSALVLLIAAANLANLQLARADRGQAAIRAALGASSGRLLRQSLTEGVLLALLGGLAALVVAASGTRALIALAFPGASFVPVDAAPSPVVLLFALVLALVTGAVFSAAPAWAMSRTPPIDALSGVGRSGHQRSFVPRRSLVVVQVALSLVLLTSAGLLATSLGNLERQPLGFDPVDRIVVRIDPPALAGEPDRLASLYARLQESVIRVPGVRAASYALYSPMEDNNWNGPISIAGWPVDAERPDISSWNRIGPQYFEATGTRIVLGRAIDERDTPGARHVAVVNATFAGQFFGSGDPIGQHVGLGNASHGGDFEIVGVAEDVKYSGANEPAKPMIFLPVLQRAEYADASDRNVQARSTLVKTLVIRAAAAGNLEAAIRRALADVDPDLTVIRVTTLTDQVSANFRLDRLMARLTSVYGALALALASLGLYGVTAYGVAQRTREIGVRMALGADRAQILRAVLAGPLAQTGVGLAIGLPFALLAGRAVASQLYGVGGQNPLVLGVATLVLAASATAAAIVPARRAAAVDPTRALRGE